MKKLTGGLENVPGFKYSAIKCGIRYENRLDYCIITANGMCSAAGVFTKNSLAAAPVRLCKERIENPIKAVLINSTNANACTGREGYNNAKFLTKDLGDKIGSIDTSVLMCSTGIIGVQLPAEKMAESHDALLSSLALENAGDVARAIMTTDTVPKQAAVSFNTSQGEYFVAGIAKGAGMIAPNMATMLCFITTNAPVERERLQNILEWAADETFNNITIDGDTSTNDTLLALSPIEDKPISEPKDIENFAEALYEVAASLAEQLVRDGEGATKFIRINVVGARTNEDAMLMAKSISRSLLVKTAFFGEDPNWGRIAMAIGNSGGEILEDCLSISFGDCTFLDNGHPREIAQEKIKQVMSQKEITVTVDCHLDNGEAEVLTSDLSYEYVKINADYST